MNRTCAALIAMTTIGCADADPSTGQMEQRSKPTPGKDQTAGKVAAANKSDAGTIDRAMSGDAKPDRKLCDGVAELKLRIFFAPFSTLTIEPRNSRLF